MTKPKIKMAHASGKRKKSVARATARKGTGKVRVNSMILQHYSSETARLMIMEPLILAEEKAKEVDIDINVSGGGAISQADASRVAVSTVLVDYFKDNKLREKFINYDRKLLVSDTRQTEPQKPYRSAARSKRQTSKR
jgi:small subunit ribosomal protein S9